MIPHPGLILIRHSFKLINEEGEVIKATDSCSFISAATPEAFRAAPQRLHNYYHRHTVVSVFSDGHWPSSAPVLWVCTVKLPAVTSGNQTVRIRPSVEYIYRLIHLNWFTDNLWALTDPGFKACDEASLLPVWSGGTHTCGHWVKWVYPATRWGWRGSPLPPICVNLWVC